ncbi:hypothetical protein BJ978_001365 [Agromyces terreus]|uniref:Uncharacterized protein n=1 Tax=Agromyces terreus TaxID=424795 RepID=A0A9X2KBK0_9MICO|nr:hypothetical protein [Agromyces terreus]MCP2370689.1 hypothetical protein [Agromyces terreus]
MASSVSVRAGGSAVRLANLAPGACDVGRTRHLERSWGADVSSLGVF